MAEAQPVERVVVLGSLVARTLGIEAARVALPASRPSIASCPGVADSELDRGM
jgi:hypothetical protein